jgi:hypothetical protein
LEQANSIIGGNIVDRPEWYLLKVVPHERPGNLTMIKNRVETSLNMVIKKRVASPLKMLDIC